MKIGDFMKKLKIGIFLDTYYPAIDGVVLAVDHLAQALSKNHDVVLVVPYTNTYKTDKNRPYRIIRINSVHVPSTEYRVGVISRFSKEYKKLIDERFDVIHIHSPFTIGRLGLKIAKNMDIPCVATMHTRFDFEIRRVINNRFIVQKIMNNLIKVYNHCDLCIAINHAMVKVFKDYGYKYQPMVIYNGTDLKPLVNIEENINIVHQKYHLDKNEKVLLFVGRITSIKNIFFLLDSLKLLKEDHFPFKMLFVGTGPDEKKLQEKIKEYDMENEVIMTGRILDRTLLSAIYARADLFLFPSLFDASSLVQIEAAVNETPSLFIEGSVTSDTITNNVNGYTCMLDKKAYKDKIKEIFSDPIQLKKVSHNARIMLGKNWDDIALETYELYVHIINAKFNFIVY